MDQPGQSSRRSRWVMSAGAVVAVGGVLAGTVIASAAGPALPNRTPAQLLAAMSHAKLPSAMTAVVSETANLGFPALPNIPGLSSSMLSAASLITGTHTASIWYAGPQHVRVAVPVSFGETDLRVNGREVWLWDSRKQTATRYILPATLGPPKIVPRASAPRLPPGVRILRGPHGRVIGLRIVNGRCKAGLRVRAAILRGRLHGLPLPRAVFRAIRGREHVLKIKPGGQAMPAGQPGDHDPLAGLTPLQVAQKLLALVGPTTKVTVDGTVTVAGRPAYQLSIAPRSSGSLVGQIVVAVDAKLYLPLRVQVFARGSSSPAFQFGFTSLTIGKPAMSNFSFTPPAGAKVKTVRLPGQLPAVGMPGWIGMPGGAAGAWVPRPAGMPPPAGRMPVMRIMLPRRLHGSARPVIACGLLPAPRIPVTGGMAGLAGGPRVLGSGWLSVLVVPAMPALTSENSGRGPRGLAESAMQQPAVSDTLAVPGPASPFAALIHTLLNAATKVHGSWGSGRLLRTSLFSVLITSKGDVLIGAVAPAVLYADAAKVK